MVVLVKNLIDVDRQANDFVFASLCIVAYGTTTIPNQYTRGDFAA